MFFLILVGNPKEKNVFVVGPIFLVHVLVLVLILFLGLTVFVLVVFVGGVPVVLCFFLVLVGLANLVINPKEKKIIILWICHLLFYKKYSTI